VKESVLASTNGLQQSWESNGLSHRVYLTEQPKIDSALVPRLTEATELWERIRDTKELGVLEAFASRYRDTLFAELARARIEALQKKAAAPQPAPATQPANAPAGGKSKCFSFDGRQFCP
jgi:hypothetical protein